MSATKKEAKAAETKQKILHAARTLFAEKGYATVTMREIAKEAGCSHTAIYMYYKDKESLLEHIALPPLEKLYEELQHLAANRQLSSLAILQKQCCLLVEFGLENQTLYPVYFMIKAERVDLNEPKLQINRIRNALFQALHLSVQKALLQDDTGSDLPALNEARLIFYQLHGTIMTYVASEEPIEEIKKRVLPLVVQGVEALIRGLKER